MGAVRRCRRRERRMDGHEVERLLAVERYRRGESIAAICVSLKRSRSWFYKWLSRADHEERAWYEEQSRRRHDPGGCAEDLRARIVQTRGRLEAAGTFVRAQMIAWGLGGQQIEPPSISTIKRILKAAGLTVPKRRMPKGTKYPAPLAVEPGSVHQFDFVGPRYAGGKRFYSLNGVDLATGRAAAEPVQSRATEHVIPGLWNVWTRMGIPSILQLDNELVFWNRRYPSAAGQVMRLCFAAGCGARFHPDPRAVAKWRGREVQRSLEPHVLPPHPDVFVRHRSERVASVRRPPQLHVAIPEDRRLYAE